MYARLGICSQPDDAALGFAEMMTIKLGELVDQPRQMRIGAYQVTDLEYIYLYTLLFIRFCMHVLFDGLFSFDDD